ncbi:hypothetical protein AX774_g5139 [Zancudomyces culisetae]|uniref:Uncharacterized protein n=1 Tax=Zancudomyces culisetae TaxID=1213189 RepID=A0A1R1PKF4_ZANCU|nr:hypothetical protein AX774_g5139 [Zancudomyces culisetae]|eukprot:OMH81403.1 hypothetical protein AX774_g5139 [Zancudomyces culisetae]
MVKITLAGVSVTCVMLAANATPVAQPVGKYGNPAANAYQNQQLAAAVVAAAAAAAAAASASSGMAGLPHGAQRSILRNTRAAELADRGIFDMTPEEKARLNDILGGIANGVAQSNVVGNFVSSVISFLPFSGALGNLINGAVSGLASGINTANSRRS